MRGRYAGAIRRAVLRADTGPLLVLIAQGRIVPGTDLDLAQTLIGVAVRAGGPKPDISTVDAFRQALLRAKTIAVPGSSTSMITDVLSRLGISIEIWASLLTSRRRRLSSLRRCCGVWRVVDLAANNYQAFAVEPRALAGL